MYYLEEEGTYKVGKFSSVYRCWIDNNNHNRTSTNHMGKAADLHIFKKTNNIWSSPSSYNDQKSSCDHVRQKFVDKANAQIRWSSDNKLSLEPSNKSDPTEFVATTWVHVDVREFEKKYLEDKFFCKNLNSLDGEHISKYSTD
jgi:hypothetical protein